MRNPTPDTASNAPNVAPVDDYRYDGVSRSNNPSAGMAAQGKIAELPKQRFEYDPHLPPVLRFDATGKTDQLPELLNEATKRPLNDDEARLLADALRNHQPYLEWTDKRKKDALDVDAVALHVHERVSAKAILKLAAREDITGEQLQLFAAPKLSYREAVQFYKHEVPWSNRLILGDSLAVMASLSRRENMAGKVQCIYMDPPYGIKYGSNFQSEVGKRDVKDGKAEDLTREVEMVKAYRDTWHLGVHSYLTYLRDRLVACKEMLTDSGSIFVQISDENLHRVRALMDEVFGPDNFVAIISFSKTTGFSNNFISSVCDYIIWHAKDIDQLKYRQLYKMKEAGEEGAVAYRAINTFPLDYMDIEDESSEKYLATSDQLTSQGTSLIEQSVEHRGREFVPSKGLHWKTNVGGMKRLFSANRVFLVGNSLRYLRYLADFNVYPISATWVDTGIAGFAADKMYVVQTLPKVIERCILMTTDPGDLVFDPTCGSGTTAFVAEQWGRRWITCDTSRVALAIARQRLLTAKFDYYTLADSEKGVMEGFKYKTVPHITLKSIAQNTALDPIFAEHEPILRQKLAELNHVLSAHNTPELRNALKIKLALKEKKDGKNSITDADRRRWLLPPDNRAAQQKQEAEAKKQGKPSPFTVPLDAPEWYAWEVPFDSDPDWPEALQIALTDYRTAWRAKMDAVNAAIAARAEQEPLVDQPAIERGKVRVCGPFTVEGVQPLPLSVDVETGDIIGGAPEELDTFDAANAPDQNEAESAAVAASRTAEGYLERMLRLLKADGVRFAENKVVHVTDLAPLSSGLLHASGHWTLGESERDVAVMFGPEYGPLTADMVEDAIHEARRGYDDLILAGFSFTAEAHALIADDPNPKLRLHSLLIRPDAAPTMDGLLKDPKESKKTDAAKKTNNQIFTVTGSPRVTLNSPDANGEYTVEMEGVDIYDPVNNAVITANATQVAAWFLDSDYDGYTFCITQAFFPDKSAWEKLSRDLSKVIDPDRFAAFSGTTSLPFPPGDHHRAAVKVIDPRGNEVMKIVRLQAEPVYVEHKNEY